MNLLIAPTEPNELKDLGKVNSLTEVCGVDVMWQAFDGLVGVQRKEVNDLFSSIDNGRLNTELAKARGRLKVTWLLIEGQLFWGRDGRLGGRLGTYNQRWHQRGFWAFLSGIQASGVFVAFTDSLDATCLWLESTYRWSQKEKHESLYQRPKPSGKWGTKTSTEWMVHLLQSFQGVSTGRALAILKKYPAPLAWTVTEEELLTVPGIGPKLARQLTAALGEAMVPVPPAVDTGDDQGRQS